jgi:hypothetical protein
MTVAERFYSSYTTYAPTSPLEGFHLRHLIREVPPIMRIRRRLNHGARMGSGSEKAMEK